MLVHDVTEAERGSSGSVSYAEGGAVKACIAAARFETTSETPVSLEPTHQNAEVTRSRGPGGFRTQEAHWTVTEKLQRVLLEHLINITPRYLPGVDGRTLDDVLGSYRDFAVRGIVPNQAQLVQRNPDLGGELQVFFAGAL